MPEHQTTTPDYNRIRELEWDIYGKIYTTDGLPVGVSPKGIVHQYNERVKKMSAWQAFGYGHYADTEYIPEPNSNLQDEEIVDFNGEY